MDGNDVLAVYRAASEAVVRARQGGGPTLIACMTYRLCGHSRSDPRTYRTKEEEETWKLRDPISNFPQQLLTSQQVAEARLQAIEQEVEALILEASEFAENSPLPVPEDVYTDVYA